MSPTSYQTAPPRTSILSRAERIVKCYAGIAGIGQKLRMANRNRGGSGVNRLDRRNECGGGDSRGVFLRFGGGFRRREWREGGIGRRLLSKGCPPVFGPEAGRAVVRRVEVRLVSRARGFWAEVSTHPGAVGQLPQWWSCGSGGRIWNGNE